MAQAAKSDVYPARTVTLVVGFAAGGPTDSITRLLADVLSRRFGVSFVVENRLGANGGVAAQHIKNTPADGYTLFLGGSGTLVVAPNLNRHLQYDTMRDFTPVARVSDYPYFLVVANESPLQSIQQLIATAREKGEKMSYASAGIGAGNHMAAEWFKSATGIQSTHVPYKGDAAALTDVLAGRVDFSFLAGVVAEPYIKADKLRVLGVTSLRSNRADPGVPKIAEAANIPGYAVEPWTGIFGPPKLPQKIVDILSVAINEEIAKPEFQQRLQGIGQFSFPGSPKVFDEYIRTEYARWAKVVQDAKIPLQDA
jgi:tripartite-type tricarboxylate transporter receptor subunit TctC